MGQAERPPAPEGLNPDELRSAQQILEQVANLRNALHQLEYLERLPKIIDDQQKRLQELEQQQLDQEQKLRNTQQAIVQAEAALMQAEAKVVAAGAEPPPRVAPAEAPKAPSPGAAPTPEDQTRRGR